MPTDQRNQRRQTPWSVASLGRALDTHVDRGIVRSWVHHPDQKGAAWSITMHDGDTFEFQPSQVYAFCVALASSHRYTVRVIDETPGEIPLLGADRLLRLLGHRNRPVVDVEGSGL